MKRLVGFALAAAFAVGTFVVVAPAESATLRIGAHRALMGGEVLNLLEKLEGCILGRGITNPCR